MLIESLISTQFNLRDWDAVGGMSSFCRGGGFFTSDVLKDWSSKNKDRTSQSLIQISKFEDDVHYIHDGHHRTLGIYLGDRDYLREDEFQITDWTYAEYMEISFENSWLTPFDPRAEVRSGDFFTFKKRVWEIYEDQSPGHAFHLIKTRPELFKIERTFYHVKGFLKENVCV